MKAQQIEITIARLFGERVNIIVPNISWGFGVHECDLLIITKAGYAIEVEIKISKSDLIKDANKRHGHYSKKIRRLFFAIPEELKNCISYIPEHAGIIIVKIVNHAYKLEFMRQAKINPLARKLTSEEMLKVSHLGCMRTWKLRETINRLTLELYKKNELS